MKELSVLVCDDSATIRQQMIKTLKSVGIATFYEAADGEEAVQICYDKKPNLVFMDIIMPKKDGIAALKEITQNYPSIKVIIASSTTGHAHLKKALLLGAYAVVQKPVDEKTARDILKKYRDERSDSPPADPKNT
ncbi:two-component system, chemotaxis family, response regulator CheY [Evansella caseinilytica]|uniref:Two-component system, chemotaxis family, response regulator CheY n=1 Tax=Evansella caseinilytica TaxID=1503961 RepID=A0A1H3R0Q6_9BACI|nr:response regulator [Evansella caseinilytica]SDZ18519.1 two-component system, chemotaxis family, response regulator CheY [Evansella caseinilytica]